jgi:hypothetical protein
VPNVMVNLERCYSGSGSGGGGGGGGDGGGRSMCTWLLMTAPMRLQE